MKSSAVSVLRFFLPLGCASALFHPLDARAQLRTLQNYAANAFYSTDDDSSDAVDLGFTIHFSNTDYSSLFINNNGNVTFDFASGLGNPSSLAGGLGEQGGPVLAPFFADVDTTYTNPLTYGAGTLGGHAAFVVKWDDVASFGQQALRNQFQLVIIDRSDVAAGDFDFEFNYGYIHWDAGANAVNGLSALMGYSDAQGQSFLLSGSGIAGSFLDGNATSALIHHQLGTPFDGATMDGRYTFNVRGGLVSAVTTPDEPQDPDPGSDPTPNPSPVPEPSTYGAFATLLLLLGGALRRMNRRFKWI